MTKMLTFLIVVGIEYLKSPVIYQVRLVGGRRCTVDYGVTQFFFFFFAIFESMEISSNFPRTMNIAFKWRPLQMHI